MSSQASSRSFSGLGRKLTEHRVESTIGVVTCLIGLIFGVIAFRKEVRSKLFAAIGLVSMLVSCKLYCDLLEFCFSFH